LADKTIIPFGTHGGSGVSSYARVIKEYYPNANVLESLGISGSSIRNSSSKTTVENWLKRLGIDKQTTAVRSISTPHSRQQLRLHSDWSAIQRPAWHLYQKRQKVYQMRKLMTSIALLLLHHTAAYDEETYQVLLRWHLQCGTIAIPGSTNAAHIAEDYDIFDFELTPDEMQRIRSASRRVTLA
jgi:hypothetical protein